MDEHVKVEILAAHADLLNQGQDACEEYLTLFPDSDSDVSDLMRLAARVHFVLRPVYPNPVFRLQLKQDLLAAARSRGGEPSLPILAAWREDAGLWMESARRHLPGWTTSPWTDNPLPPTLMLAALSLTGAGVLVYLRHRDGQRREHATSDAG
ncbi:MAG: hypothetical protein U0768_07645 [Anaerolineae bacterium]